MTKDEFTQTMENLLIFISYRPRGLDIAQRLTDWEPRIGWMLDPTPCTKEDVVSRFNEDFKQRLTVEDLENQVWETDLEKDKTEVPEEFIKAAKPRTGQAKERTSFIDLIIQEILHDQFPITRMFMSDKSIGSASDAMKRANSIKSTLSVRCHASLKNLFQVAVRRFCDDEIVVVVITKKHTPASEVDKIAGRAIEDSVK